MPALPARKVKAVAYTFNSPVVAVVFVGDEKNAADQISLAFRKGGFKAANSKAKEITRETIAARKGGDWAPTVKVAVKDSSGKFDTLS